jgi:hypothetical protein
MKKEYEYQGYIIRLSVSIEELAIALPGQHYHSLQAFVEPTDGMAGRLVYDDAKITHSNLFTTIKKAEEACKIYIDEVKDATSTITYKRLIETGFKP